ncbi:hypothetical protein AAG570_010230 [Ranatra chinensis]|uniref:Major facilitator superfamily (MFS) profile domain-containing protein n=1 Tax=Ranatra chinensis TaxID=642074 RepID=A0ABD0YLX9_9HEMI
MASKRRNMFYENKKQETTEIGMFLGTFVWGAMSDTLGRKYVMIVCLLLDFLASLATSFSFHKWFLLACRTVNGFGVVGTTSLVFAYMGEFLYPEQRDTLLLSLELFWSLGLTYIPGLLILRMDFSTDIGFTTYNPWNLFVFVSGLTSLLALLALVSLPESPKFLMTDGQLEKTRNILVRMFTVNTRRPESEYPVHLVIDPVTIRRYMRLEGRHVSMRQESTVYIKGLGAAHMNLFRTLPVRIAKTCLIDFAVSFSYWSLVLWIPELLYRHQMYTKGGEGVSLCEAATGVPGGGQDAECQSRIDNDVFYHSLTICASCIPTTLVVYLMIMYIDKRIVLGNPFSPSILYPCSNLTSYR